MTYQLSVHPGIIRHNDDGSTSYIPDNLQNIDWVAYQAWLALGNTPEAA